MLFVFSAALPAYPTIQYDKEPTIKKSIGKAKKDEKNNEEEEARGKGYRGVAEKSNVKKSSRSLLKSGIVL